MFYSWNTSAERSYKGEGSKTLEKELDLPAGTNTLHIKIVDINGVEILFLVVAVFEIDGGNAVIDEELRVGGDYGISRVGVGTLQIVVVIARVAFRILEIHFGDAFMLIVYVKVLLALHRGRLHHPSTPGRT